jgi:hypothetical protein
MICTKCKRRLKADATSCLCGWSENSAKNEFIPCAFSPCAKKAICRIFTRGWINVCFDHYTSANFTRPIPDSPVIKEVLEAFAKSRYMRRKSEIGAEAAKDELMREPGQDEEEHERAA